jgi:hypothetical protein
MMGSTAFYPKKSITYLLAMVPKKCQKGFEIFQSYGLVTNADASYDLVLRNFLVCNGPANIVNYGTGDNIRKGGHMYGLYS